MAEETTMVDSIITRDQMSGFLQYGMVEILGKIQAEMRTRLEKQLQDWLDQGLSLEYLRDHLEIRWNMTFVDSKMIVTAEFGFKSDSGREASE